MAWMGCMALVEPGVTFSSPSTTTSVENNLREKLWIDMRDSCDGAYSIYSQHVYQFPTSVALTTTTSLKVFPTSITLFTFFRP